MLDLRAMVFGELSDKYLVTQKDQKRLREGLGLLSWEGLAPGWPQATLRNLEKSCFLNIQLMGSTIQS